MIFSLPSDFELDDKAVVAVQPSQASEQPAAKPNTKERSIALNQPGNIPKKTRRGRDIHELVVP